MAVIKNMIVRVGADLSGLTSEFKKSSGATGSFAKQTEQALKNSTLSLGNLKKAMAQGGKNEAIVSLTDRIRELEAEQKALKAAGFSWGYEGFEENEKLLRDLKGELDDYIRSLKDTGESTEEVAEKTGKLGAAAQSTKSRLKDIASNVLSLSKRSKTSTAGLESLVRSIRRIGLVTAGLHLVKSIFGELGSIVRQYISQNEALQAQTTALKNSLGQALAPAINLVANALSAVMPYIVGVSNAIGSLITNLFGSGWTTVAADANAAAKAIGGAGGAQKEFNRQLAGFDEITKLNAESIGGGGGGGGGASSTTAAVEAITPAWLSGLSEKIQKFAEEGNYFSIGESLATALNEGIKRVKLEPTSLGTKVGKWVKNALSTGFGFISTFDWYGAAELIADNFSDALAELVPKYAEIKEKLTEYSNVSNNPYVNVDLRPSETNGEKLFKQIQANLDTYSRVSKNPRVNVDLRPSETAAATLFRQAKEKLTEYSKVSNNPHVNVDLRPSETAAATLFRQVKEKLTEYSKVSKNPRVNVDAQANLITHKDSLKNKLVDFIADIKSWRDSRKNKSLDTEANLTTVKDSTKKPTLNTTAIITTYHDGLKDKSISFNANMQTWTDNLKDKQVNLRAQITKDWTGSLADYLGISVIKTKLQVETPKISVSWSESKSPIGGSTIANPKFQVAYNAYGALFNGASLLGLAGGKFQVAGEAGREVLLNVDRHTWWMDLIADKVVARSAGSGVGGELNITVNLVVDGKVLASTVVRNVNAQARATGRNPLAAYM